MKSLELILEKQEDELWGRVEAPGFLYTTSGETIEEVTSNIKELIADFFAHEGKAFPEWQGITIDNIAFDYTYDLTAFFEVFSELKMGAIASRAGINQTLMRQYASGHKHPSSQQAKKIEQAVHQLATTLQQVHFA
ncbi:hypothetical protein [Spirosoma sp.]|uniref:type II toxin-antitoxin system HicB family antitoxin n=1 Tax=Spirosoma sp. TaxID=1899569 RepID=UPI0026133C7C|nr:hypothetical protein [Spirosoma sp.]MCX6216417.1 hypothetical protein [Spirosoma sp.]